MLSIAKFWYHCIASAAVKWPCTGLFIRYPAHAVFFVSACTTMLRRASGFLTIMQKHEHCRPAPWMLQVANAMCQARCIFFFLSNVSSATSTWMCVLVTPASAHAHMPSAIYAKCYVRPSAWGYLPCVCTHTCSAARTRSACLQPALAISVTLKDALAATALQIRFRSRSSAHAWASNIT